MKLLKLLSNRLFKTSAFKAVLGNYLQSDQQLIVPKAALVEQEKQMTEQIQTTVAEQVKTEIQKADMLKKNEALRYRMPHNINSSSNPDRKPFSDLPFSYLRRMAVMYPIARACINRRIRQITQLSWDITTVDDIEGEKGNEKQISIIKQFFKQPMGHKTRMREMLTIMVDDVLTIDAVSFEMQRLRGGQFMHLIPVDPTTIALRVTDTGGTPEPPQIAYQQIIGGKTLASFNTNEMIYEVMNPRSYTPYGLAPLESLIIQIESAIRGALYNLNYFRDNNIPEGFITLPEDVAVNKEQIEQWQLWFDAILAGDQRMIHRLKILPNGSEYTTAKKPEDMAFERFELWLLQQTCAVFDVQPQDIGITLHVNKATAGSQQQIGDERGLYPLANFLKEIFDDLIQIEMLAPQLQFKWTNIDPVDEKLEAEIAKVEMDKGALSVDEYRLNKGLKPLGLGHYLIVGNEIVMVADLVSGKYFSDKQAQREQEMQMKVDAQNNKDNGGKDKEQKGEVDDEEKHMKLELLDLRKWRNCVYNDLERGKPVRKTFASTFIDKEVADQITKALDDVFSKDQAKILFDMYLDPEVKASINVLKFTQQLKKMEHEQTQTD